MRKILLSVLLACLVTAVAFAGKEETYVLYQGFEDGTIPVGWTQEYGTDVQQPWIVESADDATYPKSTFAGSKYVALRNNTSQTQHFVTKLVTPVFDIQETFQPILVFSHAQPQRTGDVDILRVYYRTSSESRWVKLKEYTEKITNWKTDTISLPAANATYQLAFEGTDNFGRGIVLDEIIVRPLPTCDDPSNISPDGLTANSTTLRWNASLDADSFHVILSETQLSETQLMDLETATGVVKDTIVTNFQCHIVGLERDTRYYVYIQAYCVGTTSEWGTSNFRTKNLVTLPYKQNFDMEYASGTVDHAEYWSYGTSIKRDDGSMEYMPFVNRNTSPSNRKYYSYTQTTCLVFAGERSVESVIPAGNYVYAATPEIVVDDIKNVQVSFWGTCYQFVGSDYAGGLIVGVMTDPQDFNTFVPVDTVYITTANKYDRFTIYLDNYKGDGTYIGFASNFMDQDNIFYLDDVEVKESPVMKDITDLKLSQIRAGSFVVNANMNGNQQMELLIVRDTFNMANATIFLDPTKLPESYILQKQVIAASQLPYKVEHKIEGAFAQIYVRPVNGENFTLPVKLLAPMKKETDKPLFIGFEENEGRWLTSQLDNFFSTSTSYSFPYSIITTGQQGCSLVRYPNVTNYDPKSGKYSIVMGWQQEEYSEDNIRCRQEHGDYIAMPECEKIQEVLLHFYMRAYSTSESNTCRVAVGVMSDPFDIATFDTVAICECPDAVYRPFATSFANYKGKGSYPAIMAIPAQNKYLYSSTGGSETYKTYMLSYQRIDDIALMRIGDDCIAPADINAVPTDSSLTITWSAHGMNKWVVRTYDVTYDRSQSPIKDVLTLRDSVVTTTPSAVVKGLKPHTPYYYSVGVVCADTITKCDQYFVTTECSAYESIPYIEDFEDWKGGSSNPVKEPMGWTFDRFKYVSSSGYGTSTSYYPYISTYGSHFGKQCFSFGYSSAIKSQVKSCHLALPLMGEDINKLQMQFYAKPGGSAYVGDTLYVGVMTDPTDVATFDTVAVCRLSENAYMEFIVRFANYKGNGKYIAFMKPYAKATRDIYIDDIKVDYLSDCEKIQGVSVRNTSVTGAVIYWQKDNAVKWNVLLATDTMTLGSVVNVDGTKVLSLDTVTTMPFRVTKCPTPNTNYYVYVRAVCGDKNFGEWSLPAKFKTTCTPLTAGEMGLIDFTNEGELDCWTVGVREGTTAAPYQNTQHYLYMFNTEKSDGAYAIMPLLDIDSITRLQVSFDAHGGTSPDYLRQITVGVISNPTDLSTFTAIRTLSLNKVSSTMAADNCGFDEAARYTVRFDGYTGDYNGDYGKQIMFISESGDKKNYVYIRNIKVDTIGACMEPVLVKATEVNTYDATIQWEKLGGDYQLQLLSADASKVLQDTIVKDTTSVRLTNLEMLTKYCVKVRQICGVGDTSKWSDLISFKTACPVAYPLPFSENFDDYTSGAGNLPDCWGNITNASSSYPCVYSSAKKDGKNGLRMYNSSSKYSYAILPKLEGKISDMLLSFDYRSGSASKAGLLVIGVATDISSAAGIDSTMIQIDTIVAPAFKAPDNVWLYYSKVLSNSSDIDGYLVLCAPMDKTNTGEIYLDNLSIEKAPTCFRPYNFEFVKATPTSVTITWKPFGQEKAWDVVCLPKGGTMDENVSPIMANTTTFTVTGLSPATTYDFYVRANCGDNDVSTWTDKVTESTLYLVELADAHWNFDNLATQVPNPLGGSYILEAGWMFGNTKNSGAAYVPHNMKNTYHASKTRNSHYALSDSSALIIGETNANNNGSFVILPEINTDMDAVQIRFSGRSVYGQGSKISDTDSTYYVTYANGTYQHAIKVGTVTDPYDISTFELLTDYQFKEITDKKTIVADGHWEEVIVPICGAKGKYITLVSDYDAPNIVYIDNVVVEKETGCNAPTKLQVADLTHSQGTFSWMSSKAKWNVKITTGKDSIVDQAMGLNTKTWVSNKLTERTDYIFAVQAVGADGTLSKWATYSFTTPCAPATREGFTYNFEENLEKYVGSCELPGCWEGGQLTLGGTSTANMPQAIANTKSAQYSRNGEGNVKARALRLKNTSSYTNSYVVLPETGFDLDSVSLHFWARAAYFYPMTHTNVSLRGNLNDTNNKYQRTIVIGAVADVEDLNTFVPLDTFTYSQSWSSRTGVFIYNDETGNNYWEEVVVPLAKYAGKGRIMILYPDNGQKSYFFIDDLEIVSGDFCSSANNLQVKNINSHSADLLWGVLGNDSVHLQLATNLEFEAKDIVVDSILVNVNGKFAAKNLKAGQDYYFRVQHLCSAEEIADWATSEKFVTDYEVRFYEDFSVVRTYPEDWNRASIAPNDVFSGSVVLSDKYVAETGQNWTRSVNGLIAANDIHVPTAYGTGTTNDYWLVSPIINMTDIAEGSELSLSFLLGLSNNNDGLPNPTLEDDKFFVAVSEDAGLTWKRENTTWWSDAEDDNAAYSYRTIPFSGQMYHVDMAKYIGKRIQIAFVSTSKNTATKNYLRLAQVSLNTISTTKYREVICRWEDYSDANFDLDAINLQVGDTCFQTYRQSKKAGVADRHIVMNLTVLPDTMTTIPATICEGEDYTSFDFDIKNVATSQIYKRKLVGANTCDSIVLLDLKVLPRLFEKKEVTICQGDFYEFNGVKYYTNTTHADTLKSAVTGCDSIVTLYLTVNNILKGETDIHLCEGQSVEFGKFGQIKAEGTYVDTVKNALGCDSVATLNVFVHKSANTIIRAAICEGETYTKYVWQGLSKPGDYSSVQKTVWGCDSTATLHLMVVGEDLTLCDSISTEELPYVFNEQELLSVGTTEGTYTRQVNLNCGVATLTIVVGEPTGLHSVFASSLAIAPNPVSVGQDIRILGSFASDAVVEVMSTTGARIYRAAGIDSPIVIPGISTEGVYLVTVTSNGQLFQAKLIVQ